MIDIPTLETDRLRLRPHRVEDFDAYARMWADPLVLRFMGVQALTREQSWSRFLRQMGVWQCLGFGFFALEDRQTGEFAGECGFHDLHRDVTPSIEGTMEAVAAELTRHISIPTIGIGASADCDGQILVIDDMVGMTVDRVPKFVKEYANLRGVIADAAARYAAEVRGRAFPGPDHVFTTAPAKDEP